MATTKSPFDADMIRALAEILKETDLTEIEIEQKDMRVKVARHIGVATHVSQPVVMGAPTPGPAPALEAGPAPVAVGGPGTLTSPMVGTCYRAPAPDKPNFVEIGAQVRAGQTVLIIEAMKTFNEIPAHRAGVVKDILVAAGDPVEFGQPLLVIE